MLDSLLAQIQDLVKKAYAQGLSDAAAPLAALEKGLSQELSDAQAQVEALIDPPAPPADGGDVPPAA